MDAELGARIAASREALEARVGTWRPRTLAETFDATAEEFPDRPFVITEEGTLSYAQVQQQSKRIAAGLIALGVEHGDRVAMLMDNRLEYPLLKFAIARVGAVAVALNYSYRAGEIMQRLRQSGATLLVSIDASTATDFLSVYDAQLPGWERGVHNSQVPDLRTIVMVAEGMREGALDLGRVAAMGDIATVEQRMRSVSPDDLSDIVFTSGTSGNPLGAELTHDMLLRSAYGSAYHRGFMDGWRVGFALPLYHVFGYIEAMLTTLYVGGAIVPQRVFNPRTTLLNIQKHRVNEQLFVPTMTIAVVDQAVKGEYDLSSLESVVSAASEAPMWLWERVLSSLHPRMLFTGYGQSEVSAGTTMTNPGDDLETISATVGVPKLGGAAVAGTGMTGGRLAEYRTVDPFTGEFLPPGEPGELVARGPLVTRRYAGDPERTAEAIDAQGWLRTGDLGRVREDGYLELHGRSKELFKVGGELVAPLEIEGVLAALAGVSQAYVAGVPERRYGEVPWAWVVPTEGVQLDEHEIIAYCRQNLAPFKVPRGVTLLAVEELPMTTTGKIQKFMLVRRHLGELATAARSAESDAPSLSADVRDLTA